MYTPQVVQVIATKPSSKILYQRAPTTLACHIEGAEVSVFNTGEITLVFFGLHRDNLDERGDMGGNRKYIKDMKMDLIWSS